MSLRARLCICIITMHISFPLRSCQTSSLSGLSVQGLWLFVRLFAFTTVMAVYIVLRALHTFPYLIAFAFVVFKSRRPAAFVRRIPNDNGRDTLGIHLLEGLPFPTCGRSLRRRPVEPEEPIERRGPDVVGGTRQRSNCPRDTWKPRKPMVQKF